MKRMTRRAFLKRSAAAGCALPLFAIAGTKASGPLLGANEQVRVGVAGINGQGNGHLDEYLGTGEGAEQANSLLTRRYRPPFIVPDVV